MHLAQLPVRPLPELGRLMSLRGGFGGVVEATSQGDVWFAGLSALIQQTTLYLGTGMAAMAGTITAGSKEMDLFGCVIVGCITAIGGGTLRDIILGRSVYWLQDRTHLNISLAVSIAIFLTWPFLKSLGFRDSHLAFLWSDALGMSSSCIVGTHIGLVTTRSSIVGILCGVLTSVGGGIMRDLLCLDKPRALHAERSMYATPALAGAVLYSVLRLAAAGDGAATSAAAAVEAAAAAIWDTAGGAHDVPDSGSTLAWLARLLGWGGSPPVSPRGAAAAAAARRPGAPAATTASRDLTASLPFDATYFVPWAVCLLLRWAAWTWRLALPHWARRRQSIFGDVTRSLRPLMLTPSEPTFTVSLKKAQSEERDPDWSSFFRPRTLLLRRWLFRPVLAGLRRPPKLRGPLVPFRARRAASEERKNTEGDSFAAAQPSAPAASKPIGSGGMLEWGS